MAVTRFEDLIAWQRARELTRAVYEFTREGSASRDFGYCGQIQRAAVSVMSNIAEGFERHRPKEFHQALSTAKASCAEVRSLLYVASDIGYIDGSRFEGMMGLAEETARIVAALRTAVARKAGASSPAPSAKHRALSTEH